MARPRPGRTSKRGPRAQTPRGSRSVRPIDPMTNEPGDLPPDDWSDEPTPAESAWLAPEVDWDQDDLGYDEDELELDQYRRDRTED